MLGCGQRCDLDRVPQRRQRQRRLGRIDTSATGTVVPGQLGGHTGWLGFAWNQSRNQHWVAMGYPQGAPFAGGKIIMAASAYGYDDDWPPDAV